MNNKISKQFSVIFLVITYFLIVLSTLALISLHWNLIYSKSYHFSFTPKGINDYIKCYTDYKALFSITITTVAAYYGILRLKIATETYRIKIQESQFEEFKFILGSRISEIKGKNPMMKRVFEQIRHQLFINLIGINFSILDKKTLEIIFDNFFKEHIKAFECNDHIYKNIRIYDSDKSTYAFCNFLFLFLSCIDYSYENIKDDLLKLYLENMDANRKIDSQTYKISASNYGNRI